MRKKILIIVLQMMLVLPCFAQSSDSFFIYDNFEEISGTREGPPPPYGIGEDSNGDILSFEMGAMDISVPLGSGLLLLTVAGLGYTVLKRKEVK